MHRAIAYIDGFNLYFGLREKKWRRYYWLDVQKLAQNLLLPKHALVLTKYFTARIQDPPDKVKRQSTFLEALETLNDFSMHFGVYQVNRTVCHSCGATRGANKEKMTDVNIATELLCDAHQDLFDLALVISADSDLVPPLAAVRRLFPAKRIVVGFPPARRSAKLEAVANSAFVIGRAKVADSQFPDTVTSRSGFPLTRPASWR